MPAQPSMSAQQQVRIKSNSKEKIQGILIGCLAIGFMLLQLFPSAQIELFVSFVIIAVMVWVLPGIRGTTLYISLFLLITGVALMIYHHVPAMEWLSSMRINLMLVAIFIVVPLLGIPVKTGGYVKALKIVFSKKMNEPYFFYLGTNLLTHLLGVVINIGSVSIVNELTRASNIKAPRLVANAINRGFIMTIFWSPYFSSVALIVSHLPVKWTSIVGYLLGFVVVCMIISVLLDRKEIKNSSPADNGEWTVEKDEKEVAAAKKKVTELCIYLIAITGSVLMLEFLFSASMILMVCFVGIIFPLLWCVFSGKTARYKEEFKQHVFFGIPRMKKEIVLFLIAGFFSGAFIHADLSGLLITAMQTMFGSSQLGTSFFLSAIVLSAALIGIHPIVVITILVTSIKPELIGFSPEYFAVLLLTSWGISNTVAPATAVNNLLVSLLKVDLIDVSIRWNFKYAIIAILIVPFYLRLTGL